MNKYYNLTTNDQEADIFIFGDITSWVWDESDVSSYTLAKELAELKDVNQINVHINSYGGEVAEGLAIYNQLVNHPAKVTTYCDGFACSIASVIFMSGEERIMSDASLLMIHNPWTYVRGNAEKLRKDADDLDKMANAAVNAYMNRVSIKEEELRELLKKESWIEPAEALSKGFATSVSKSSKNNVQQSVKKSVMKKLLAKEEGLEIDKIAEAVAEKLAAEKIAQKQPLAQKKVINLFAGLK